MLATAVALTFLVPVSPHAVPPARTTIHWRAEAVAQHPRGQEPQKTFAKDYEYPAEPVPEKLVPKDPPNVEESKAIESRKLYTVGYMRLRKGKLEQAYETFKKALEYDPGSLAVLKELVPLCYRLQKGDEGLEYCRQALRLDPNNYALLQYYSRQMEEKGDIAAAIDSLEVARDTPKLREENTAAFIAVQDKLADLYANQGDYVGMARALRDLVDIAESQGNYDLDATIRRQLRQQKVRLYEKLGEALKGAKQYEEAVVVLQKGIASEPGGRRLAQTLAEVLYETGKYAQALEQLQTYLGQTQSPQAFELFEKLLSKLGRENELLPALQELTEKDRYNPVLAQFYAEKLIEHKRYSEAEERLVQIKDRPEASAALAELYTQTREPLKLLRTFANNLRVPETTAQIGVVAQKPEFVKQMAQVAREELENDPVRFQADLVVAMASRQANLIDQAKEFYLRCIEQRPDVTMLYIELIRFLYESERFEDMLEVASKAIENHPKNTDFYEYKARAFSYLKRYDEAVKLIEELRGDLAERDQIINADLLLASIYQLQENWDKAAEVCQKVIEENPDQARIPYARYLLANIYTLRGDLNLAEEQLLTLVESDPDAIDTGIRAAANNDLGYIWADEGKNLDRAKQMIETALKLNEQMQRPASAAYLDSMGWVLFKQQDYQGAVRYLKQATETESGEDAVIWDHLGDAYIQLEKADQARRAWEKAIELYTKSEREKERAKAALVQEKIQSLESGETPPPKRATKDSP